MLLLSCLYQIVPCRTDISSTDWSDGLITGETPSELQPAGEQISPAASNLMLSGNSLLYVIGSLDVGGTERHLALLAPRLKRLGWCSSHLLPDPARPAGKRSRPSGRRNHLAAPHLCAETGIACGSRPEDASLRSEALLDHSLDTAADRPLSSFQAPI